MKWNIAHRKRPNNLRDRNLTYSDKSSGCQLLKMSLLLKLKRKPVSESNEKS